MKSNVLTLILVFLGITFAAYNVYVIQNLENTSNLVLGSLASLSYTEQGEHSETGESGHPPVCKWKVYDCPGLWTGDQEVCVVIGDGRTCACGEVSRECPKD